MRALAEDIASERAALRATFLEVGPDAPSGCGLWTAEELAIHVAIGETFAGVATAPFRVLVGRGVRVDRVAGLSKSALNQYRRRHDFDWALGRLARRCPRVLSSGPVAAVSLLEAWTHHEDLIGANDIGPCDSAIDLAPLVSVLVRYQRRVLDRHAVRVTVDDVARHDPPAGPTVEVSGSSADVARWLAGRGESPALKTTGDRDAIARTTAALHL